MVVMFGTMEMAGTETWVLLHFQDAVINVEDAVMLLRTRYGDVVEDAVMLLRTR